jgi:transposase
MTAVLDELELTGLVTSITGISPVGAAAILAQTGDPRRFTTARPGQTRRPRTPRETLRRVDRPNEADRTRPTRATAGRLARGLGVQRANPVYAARYRQLTTREHNKLRPTQAQTVIAAAILRHLHAVITTGHTWDPAIATHGTRPRLEPAGAAMWRRRRLREATAAGGRGV